MKLLKKKLIFRVHGKRRKIFSRKITSLKIFYDENYFTSK